MLVVGARKLRTSKAKMRNLGRTLPTPETDRPSPKMRLTRFMNNSNDIANQQKYAKGEKQFFDTNGHLNWNIGNRNLALCRF